MPSVLMLRTCKADFTSYNGEVVSELRFDPETHTYSWAGQRVWSVTQALRAAGLIDSSHYTEYSRQRGTAVHLATQLDDEGDLDESTIDTVVLPYLQAARRFRKDTGFIPELIESRFCVPQFGYAGTLDRFGAAGKQRVIVDYKTGAIMPCVALQLAAYAYSLPNGSTFERWAVQLKDEGTYKIKAYSVADWPQHFKDFLAALRIAQLKEEYGCLPQ